MTSLADREAALLARDKALADRAADAATAADAAMADQEARLEKLMQEQLEAKDATTVARRDSHFSSDALLRTAVAWIFIPAYCFAVP